jgi:AcrR family transcriptional regulator
MSSMNSAEVAPPAASTAVHNTVDASGPAAAETRRYRSTRRQKQAAHTRADVLAAAVRMFVAHGWAGSTITAIAKEADVAVETVYSGFGSKKGLLRAAMDVAVVGDAEPIPFADRPEAAAMGEGDLSSRLAAGARVTAAVHERSVGVWQAIQQAAGGDPDIEGWRSELEARRRLEVGRSLEMITGHTVDDTTADLAWVILGPEAYLSLTRDRDLDRTSYQACITDALRRLLELP